MKNSMLSYFLKYFEYKNDPKYISNKDINEFFIKHGHNISFDDFIAIRDFFIIELNATRYVFNKLGKNYEKNKRKSDAQSNSLSIKPIDPPGIELCRERMVLKRFSRRTIKTYLGSLRRANGWFRANLNVSLDRINSEHARKFFLVLIEDLKLSASTVRLYRSSLLFYSESVEKKTLDLSFLEGMKSGRHLPSIVSRAEISQILECIKNIKHRTMIGMLYASGLRLSELVSLRVCDVNLDEMVIHVRQGKGRKDRITVFSESLVPGLDYCMQGKGTLDYVFTTNHDINAVRQRHISGRTVQKILENAVKRAGINKNVTPHDLRHSFATHLLNNGISLRHIQMLLGHKNISTTTIYTRVSNPVLKGIKSPL